MLKEILIVHALVLGWFIFAGGMIWLIQNYPGIAGIIFIEFFAFSLYQYFKEQEKKQ